MADQSDWRFCRNCNELFFNGFPDNKGTCPRTGGGHLAAGFNFLIPFNVGESPHGQGGWRNCMKCQALWFDGFPDKGVCPAGGGHELFPGSLHFRLSHPIHPFAHLADEGFRVRVGGGSYTPDERVAIAYRYNTEFGQTSSDPSLAAITNTDGFFGDFVFDLQPGAKFIAVRATDTRTGQFDEKFLRGGV